jgi:predicted AAA+ superfamily ATPase
MRETILAQKNDVDLALSRAYVKRESVLLGLENNLAKVIIGTRRAGKSFFAIHVLAAHGRFGYANFDSEKLVLVKDYDAIVSALDEVYGKPDCLLFDEIQNLPRWELFVNRLLRQGKKLVITGSNSKLLSGELATHMTGRHLQTAVFPFSFREALRARNLPEEAARGEVWEYLQKGGYPEIYTGVSDARQYLSTLFDAVLFKDIIKHYKIRAPQRMENLAIWLLSNPACEITDESLSRSTGIKSPLTARKYLRHLEEAFLFFAIGRFDFKAAVRVSSASKVYCIDTGFIAAKGLSSTPNYGRIYENAVAIELFREQVAGASRVFYWKSPQKHEVDFVVRRGLRVSELVQVCYDPSGKAKEREARALLRAGKELSCANLLVITEGYEAEEEETWFGMSGIIRYVPLWKWLLARAPHDGEKAKSR